MANCQQVRHPLLQSMPVAPVPMRLLGLFVGGGGVVAA
jgi:hypothetical protein